jgi:hypothetical protein
MGGPSPEKGRGDRHQLQIDTTQNRRETLMRQAILCSSFGKLRTGVIARDTFSWATGNNGQTMPHPDYSTLVAQQLEFFLCDVSHPAAWRKAELETLKALLTKNHDELCDALWEDEVAYHE